MTGESRWAVDMEIPSLEADSASPMTAKDAEQMWKRYLTQQPRAIERFRHCVGCIHLRQAGGTYLVCCYLLLTGRRRPCAFGDPCPVKVVPEGFRLPEEYAAWCEELDAREEAVWKKPGQRGRIATWDTEWARALFDRGFAVSEISQIIGVSMYTINSYMSEHLWNYNEDGTKRKKTFPKRSPEEIEAEKEAFERHKAETATKS